MPGRSSPQSRTGSHSFSQVPSVNLQRSALDRSHGLKTAFDFGKLIPIFVDEVLPGDTMSLRCNSFGRMATFLHPIMENLYLDFFFFFVPNRLVWDNWQRLMGEKEPSEVLTPPTIQVPTLTPTPVTGNMLGSLADYFGLPLQILGTINTHPSALPFRAYSLIYREWFRDENLIASNVVPTDDGPDLAAEHPIRARGKRHDYFTSALPWPLKGPAVALSLGTWAPVVSNALRTPSPGTGQPNFQGVTAGPASAIRYEVAAPQHLDLVAAGGWVDNEVLKWSQAQDGTGLVTNLATATAVSVNQLREAVATQRLLERDARGGTRYTELIRSHFGVISPDQRLQRPEYLGGGTVRINVNPVAATATAGATAAPVKPGTYPGDLGAFATTSTNGVGFSKSFTEHGTIIGLVSGRADLNYQQGIEKMWLRRTRYDFYWPEFAHLGEQAIRNCELFYSGTDVPDLDTFGYQERYAEYRYKPSRVTNIMRSSAGNPPSPISGTLESWHLAQDFAALPVLNQSFIEEQVDIDRVLVAANEPELLLDCFFIYRCVRPMPVYAIPGLGGRL